MKNVAGDGAQRLHGISGWRFVAVVGILLLSTTGWIGLSGSWDVPALRLIIRLTARLSLVLFCLAFCASATRSLWPNGGTRWQFGNRRYLGLSFVLSHIVHGVAIWELATKYPQDFHALHPGSNVIGEVGYFFIFAMTVTSFDTTASLLGRRVWRLLHLTGSYVLWSIFLAGEISRVHEGVVHLYFAGVLGAALAVRISKRASNLPAGNPARVSA